MFYHGTSLKRAKQIAVEGFKEKEQQEKNWVVSDKGHYFWSVDSLIEHGEDEECADYDAIQRAYDNGSFALLADNDDYVVVFEVEDGLEVEDDYSCKYMGGAVVCYDDIPPEKIKRVWISPNLSLIRGYFIAVATNNALSSLNFSDRELSVAKFFQDYYFEPSDWELTEIELSALLP